jgi:hypothetical protein
LYRTVTLEGSSQDEANTALTSSPRESNRLCIGGTNSSVALSIVWRKRVRILFFVMVDSCSF